jgi:predicted Zn-dependent peptidase
MSNRPSHLPRGAGLGAALVATASLIAGLVSAAPPVATPRPATKAAAVRVRTGLETLERQVHEFTLANGLKFVVVERHQAPVFSFMTVVDAGSSNDQIGTTGLAHMMEHMAFKGTTRIGTKDYAKERPLLDAEEKAANALLDERRKGPRADATKLKRLEAAFEKAREAAYVLVVSNEFNRRVEEAGGQNVNAYTSSDVTAYFYSLPSNRLELWALLEGSRMSHPVFREFYKERDVVYEERRMNYESTPSGRLFLEFVNAAFTAHPYGFGGIGFPSDLKTFSRTQGEEYFRRHYVAKNMVVAVVGDVTVDEVRRHATKYFADLSDAPKPPPLDTVEPEQKAERRVILEDPGQPLVMIGWHVPAVSDPRYPAYEALADLLVGGDYSRLIKTLVKEKKIATHIEGGPGFPAEKYPNLFWLFIVPAAGQDPAKVEQEAYAVLDGIRSKPFTSQELAGYKVRVKASKIAAVESNGDLASELANAQTLNGDWREFFREQERVQALTVPDVMNAMNSAFVKSNRTVAMIVNHEGQAANEGGK